MALTKVQKELLKPADSLNPTGAILMFAGSVAPAGWLLCDGTEYSKTLYPELSAVLSVGNTFPYGQTNGSGGAGTTHFKVPDFRRRVPVGSGGTGTAALANSVGATGGSETHTLTVGEMPSHTHGVAATTGGSGILYVQPPFAGNVNSITYDSTSSGNNESHNNLQPSLVVNYIIKY
jgi:microcystin-dependent protein